MYDFETIVNRRGTASLKWDGPLAPDPSKESGIVPLSIADMELKHPPEFIKALQDFIGLSTTLGYGLLTDAYLAPVQKWMRDRHGWEIEKDWLIEFPGVMPAIHEMITELLAPEEGAIIMTPVYAPFYFAITGPGRKLVENPLIYKNNRYEIDFADLEAKVQDPNNKVLLLCSPHNPIGRLWTLDELKRIGKLCMDNGVLVISDEIHFDFVMPGGKHHVFATISQEFADNCIVCTGPCKAFNLAGLQLSNIIIPNAALRDRIRKAHTNNGFSRLGSIAYKAGELAYSICGEWHDEVLELIVRNRDLVVRFLKENVSRIKPVPVEATYMQWLDCTALGMDEPELLAFMREEANLYLSNGSRFGKAGNGFLRMNLACPTHVLDDALKRLKAACDRKLS